jgi:hypothetical protein
METVYIFGFQRHDGMASLRILKPTPKTDSGHAFHSTHFECGRQPCKHDSLTDSIYQLDYTLILYLSLQYDVYQHVTDPVQLSNMQGLLSLSRQDLR